MLNSVIVPLVKNKNGDLSDRNLIGLNKLSYLDSIMYMHLHKYLFKHTYYLYIKYRPHYNVHAYICHNLKWLYQLQHRNYVWHPEGITMRYDFCVHVLIHTQEEHISMCTCRSIAVLKEQIYLICSGVVANKQELE